MTSLENPLRSAKTENGRKTERFAFFPPDGNRGDSLKRTTFLSEFLFDPALNSITMFLKVGRVEESFIS